MSRSTLMPGTPGLLLKMEEVTSLPHHELVTEFKCIEGWSQVVHWGGYRLADLIAKYPPAKKADGSLPKYVYMETPRWRLLLRIQPPGLYASAESTGD